MLKRMFRALLSRPLSRPDQQLNHQGLDAWASGDWPGAERCFRDALAQRPANASAMSNLGALLMVLHRYDEGMALLQEAVRIAPTQEAGLWTNLGNACHLGGQTEIAIAHYRRALELDPLHVETRVNILRPLLEICDWDSVEQQTRFIRQQVSSQGSRGWSLVMPFSTVFLPFDRHEQLAAARHHAIASAERPAPRVTAGRRVRLAYLSSDFHDHATLHLMQPVFGLHDRSRFEVFAYSIGYADTGPHRQRVMRDCDHFTDVHDLSDQAIAARIAADGIDILVDLKGHTGGSRPGVLALRPAPVQVNYLGYPGTMGVDFIDYLIADARVIPPEHEDGYSEKIVRLPHSYQATDHEQAADAGPQDRAAAGLPGDGFVYACFNTSAKFDRTSFTAWMQVLSQVPGSVLWLLDAPPAARRHLAAAARMLGVNPSRIVHAPALPKPRHLARLALADVCLDTFVCNAHTTATDALWMGVPLVTLTGQTFASRVATSLLTAAGLPELALPTSAEFVATAVRLAQDPGFLAQVRSVLAARAESPLFDSRAYVRGLDAAYLSMLPQTT